MLWSFGIRQSILYYPSTCDFSPYKQNPVNVSENKDRHSKVCWHAGFFISLFPTFNCGLLELLLCTCRNDRKCHFFVPLDFNLLKEVSIGLFRIQSARLLPQEILPHWMLKQWITSMKTNKTIVENLVKFYWWSLTYNDLFINRSELRCYWKKWLKT